MFRFPLTVGCFALFAPVLGSAQVISTLDAGAASVTYDNALRSTAATLTPTFRLEKPALTLLATGTLSIFDTGGWSTQGTIGASAFTPALGPLRGEVAGSAGGSTHEDLTRTGQMLGQGRIHLISGSVGLWAGAGTGRTWDGAIWREVSLSDAGAWARLGPALLVASVTPTTVGDSNYTDLEGALKLTRGGWELGAFGGTRSGFVSAEGRSWGGVSGTLWVTRHFAVIVAGGTYPADPTQGYPGGKYATVALRIASRPPAVDGSRVLAGRPAAPRLARPVVEEFQLRESGSGRRTIRVSAAGAHRVELAADFTDWKAVPMRRTRSNAWEITLPITAGIHRFNLRVDGGEWGIPPGVTAITDDFNGVVGLLTVQ